MSGVRILHFLKDMKIHSNPPKLYYGFKGQIEGLK